MQKFVLMNEHYLGRLVAQIAHGAGVPMTLVRFEKEINLPGPKLINQGFTAFVDALLDEENWKACGHWLSYVGSERYRLFASGRRYEHPFITLLRSEPLWSVWELGVLHQISLQTNTTGLQDIRLPGTMGDFIQLKVEYMPPLSGFMVYGPVPRERGFSDGDFGRAISRFEVASQRATRIPSPIKRQGGGYSSFERLRRMYLANGRTLDRQFADNAVRAQGALNLALQVDLTALRTAEPLDPSVLPTLDSVASVALTRVAHRGKPTIKFRGPAHPQREIEIVSEPGGNLSVRILQAGPTRDEQGVEAASAGIELSSLSPEQEMSDTLQDVIAQAEDRNAQAILQQFMLMRHWLNDRYARLSSMYNEDSLATDEAARSREEIVDWLLRQFDADFAAIYHVAADGILDEIASGSRPGRAAIEAAAANSLRMRELRFTPPDARVFSSAYRVLIRRSAVYIADWDGEPSIDAGMSAGHTVLNPRPYATVAVPVVVLGKIWAVIELVGFYPNQFDKISGMWLEEASQLVGNALYQSWLLKQITQANLTVLLNRETRDDEGDFETDFERNRALIERASLDKETRILGVRNDICREMAELFVADAAGLWLNNESWPGRLQLRGFFGVDFDPERDAAPGRSASDSPWPEIDIDVDDALVARLMRDGVDSADSIFWEELQPHSEPILTARGAYRAALWRSGVRRVTLVPLLETLRSEESRPIGALALYSKTAVGNGDPYGQRWVPLVEFAGRHVAMLMRSIALESERQTALELMFSHEVIGSLRRVKDQFQYLVANLLRPLSRGYRPEALRIPDRLRDIEKAESRVENGIADALDRLDEMRREGFQIPSAGRFDFRSKSAWDGTPSVLYTAIQSGFNARYQFRLARGVDWRISGTTEFIRIRLHPRDLESLCFNLADNALKYASKGTGVRVNIERRPTGNLYVDFLNLAPPLRAGEEDRLFKLGFRGQLARNGDEDGSGQGLFITHRLAQALRVGLEYETSKLLGRSDVEHRFRLIFKEEMILYGRE